MNVSSVCEVKVEVPALPGSLSITQMKLELDLATEIASEGFCVSDSPGLREDVNHHMEAGQLVFRLSYTAGEFSEEVTVGFTIFDQIGEVLYLSGIILRPEFQAKGVGVAAVRVVAMSLDSKYLALRTQSPRMWSAMNKMCLEVFPHSKINTPIWANEVGVMIAARSNSTYPVHKG